MSRDIADLLQKLDENASENPEIAKLRRQASLLREQIQELIKKIQASYEQMLDSSTPVTINVAAFKADLTPPEVVSVAPARDINDAVAEMERYFKEWDDAANIKKGKL